VEACTVYCKANNFLLAGLENGGECCKTLTFYQVEVANSPSGCGNVMKTGTKTPDADCGSACSGDPSEFCGSSVQNGGPTETTRMTVYQDTSVPVDFKTCLQPFSNFFRPDIFSQIAPSSPIRGLLLQDSTFPSDFFILTVNSFTSLRF